MIKQRVVISPDVFIWANTAIGVIYDSHSRNGFRFDNTGVLASFINELQKPDNLYSVILPNQIYQDEYKCIRTFVDRIVNNGFAKVIVDDDNSPLSMKPTLRIQDNVDYYRWLHRQSIDGEVINNIHHILVNFGDVKGCDLFAAQAPYPVYSTSSQLNIDKLKFFINSACKSPFLSEINFIGNPIGIVDENFYRTMKDIVNLKFSVLAEDAIKSWNSICPLSEFGNIELVIRLSTIQGDTISFIREHMDISLCLLIEEAEDLETLESLCIDEESSDNIRIVPLYNSNNTEFITEALSISEDELLNNGPDKRNIFIHQSINIFDFGKMYIMPDGTIRTNMCSAAIGSLDDTPCNIAYSELDRGKSWLKIRNYYPCDKCVFKSLCPSPSNYEVLIGKPLCFLAK